MTVIYSLTHIIVDLSCAFLVYAYVVGEENWYLWILIYNFCAFALQMPIGVAADRLNRNGCVAAAGCIGVLAGLGLGKAALLGIYVAPGALGIYLGSMAGRAGIKAALWAVSRIFPGAKGFGFGLLTFGLFIGFCPAYIGGSGMWSGPSFLSGKAASLEGLAVMALLALGLLIWGLKQVKA